MQTLLISEAIIASLEGKYTDVSEACVETVVREAIARWAGIRHEQDILGGAVPTFDLHSDVLNQARTYVLIENVWRFGRPLDQCIERIHAAVYGVSMEQLHYRNTAEVDDFEGSIPTRIEDIEALLLELNKKALLVDSYGDAPTAGQANFLAALFSGIVKVHPFRDGNGRTARMVVQYSLRRWGRHFLIVPKVRNNTKWKTALSEAVEGRPAHLAEFFCQQMRGD